MKRPLQRPAGAGVALRRLHLASAALPTALWVQGPGSWGSARRERGRLHPSRARGRDVATPGPLAVGDAGQSLVLADSKSPGGAGLGAEVGWGRGKMGRFGAFLDVAHAAPSAGRCSGCRAEAGCCSHRGDGSCPPATHSLARNLPQLWRSSISAGWFARLQTERVCAAPGLQRPPSPPGTAPAQPPAPSLGRPREDPLCLLHPPGPQPAPGDRNPLRVTGTAGGRPGADGPSGVLRNPRKLLLPSLEVSLQAG